MYRYEIINAFIAKFGYDKYLEIGVRGGECLREVRALVKDGVDPDSSKCPQGVNYPMPSDDFFASLPIGRQYDIVFVDGLHQHEQVVRDVENSLRFLSPGGTVLLHDCNPPTAWHASHDSNGGEWNGTVYKAILELRARRSDLEIFVVDTDWGVGVVRVGTAVPVDQAKVQAAMEDFSVFDANRTELLDLRSPEAFSNWLASK